MNRNNGILCRCWIEVMEEGEDVYFSGDQIPIFICELLLCHRLPRNVFGLLSLKVDGGVKDGGWTFERLELQ